MFKFGVVNRSRYTYINNKTATFANYKMTYNNHLGSMKQKLKLFHQIPSTCLIATMISLDKLLYS